MGDARRRGTREDRIAQAIERKKIEDAKRREQFKREEAARIQREQEQARREGIPPVLIASGGTVSNTRNLRMALALAATAFAASPYKKHDR